MSDLLLRREEVNKSDPIDDVSLDLLAFFEVSFAS